MKNEPPLPPQLSLLPSAVNPSKSLSLLQEAVSTWIFQRQTFHQNWSKIFLGTPWGSPFLILLVLLDGPLELAVPPLHTCLQTQASPLPGQPSREGSTCPQAWSLFSPNAHPLPPGSRTRVTSTFGLQAGITSGTMALPPLSPAWPSASHFFACFLFVCLFFRAILTACGSSQAEVQLELQLSAYTSATETQDLSHIFDLHHSSWQLQILNPLSEARDWTHIFMDTSWVHYCWATRGTPSIFLQNILRKISYYGTHIFCCQTLTEDMKSEDNYTYDLNMKTISTKTHLPERPKTVNWSKYCLHGSHLYGNAKDGLYHFYLLPKWDLRSLSKRISGNKQQECSIIF